MKNTELRIGNLVIYGGCEVAMNISEFIHFVRFPETYSPILISEEKLLSFGFEKCEGQHGVYFKSPHDKQVRIYFYDEKWCIGYVSGHPRGFSTIGSFIHVHKLQNFHFEFVGQELTLKTTP